MCDNLSEQQVQYAMDVGSKITAYVENVLFRNNIQKQLSKLSVAQVQCGARWIVAAITRETEPDGQKKSAIKFSKKLSLLRYVLSEYLKSGKLDTKIFTAENIFTGYFGDINGRNNHTYKYLKRYIMPIVNSVITQYRQDVALALQSKTQGLPSDIARKIAKMSMRKSPHKTRRSRKTSRRRSRKTSRRRSRPRRSR